ncbi:MAG: hypothetical protein RL477_1657, partial [Pseudomonadota bacterium]
TNPDGRIAEDIRFTTENAIELGHSLLYAFLLLASFITILWGLSGRIEVPLAGASFALPGHLVWIAVIYAAIGTFIALRLGLPLVRAQNLRQTTEADFRFGLAHTRENSLQVALLKGERSEDHRLRTLFRETVRSWFVQTRALINVFYFSSTWWVLSQVFPILVASPRYIAGTITLGVLMQTAQAFQQVVGAMSWPVDNVSRVAEWRASVERVLNLHEALGAVRRGDWPASAQSVQVETSLEPKLSLRALALAEPDGTPMMSELSAQILPGERVFIAADAITGFRLVRAMAQLWPWGRGAVSLPRNGPVFFVSRHPYLPIGRLKDVLAYPQAAEAYSETTFNDALTRVGLDRLCCDIDRKAAWEEALSADERRRLGIARILIARPNWIVLQEIVETFDPATATHMVCCIADACPGAAIVIVGGEPAFDFRAAQRFTVTAVAVAAQAARRG